MTTSSNCNRITDREAIREVMHAHMLAPDKQRAPFLAVIFTREHWPAGTIHEGARPLGASTDPVTGEVTYALTNSDSGYRRAFVQVKLSGIEYVETLR